MPTLSIVMPAQDEARRLPRTLQAICDAPSLRTGEVEVVVVDDGSRDDTAAAAQLYAERLDVRVLRVEGRRGVGVAARAGMLAARGERVLFCDADGAVPFTFVSPLWQALDAGADVAIGSRRAEQACIVVAQPRHRIVMGRVWGRLVRGVLPLGLRDTQCGFKLFTRRAARTLFSRARCRTFAFHVEVLAAARDLELRVAELPVHWSDVPGSKIRIGRDSLAMAVELGMVAARRRLHRALEPAPTLELHP